MHAVQSTPASQTTPSVPHSDTPIYDELTATLGDPRMAPIQTEAPGLFREDSLGYLPRQVS